MDHLQSPASPRCLGFSRRHSPWTASRQRKKNKQEDEHLPVCLSEDEDSLEGTACHHDCEEMILDMQQMNVTGGAAARRVNGSVSDHSAEVCESQAYLFLPATVMHAQEPDTTSSKSSSTSICPRWASLESARSSILRTNSATAASPGLRARTGLFASVCIPREALAAAMSDPDRLALSSEDILLRASGARVAEAAAADASGTDGRRASVNGMSFQGGAETDQDRRKLKRRSHESASVAAAASSASVGAGPAGAGGLSGSQLETSLGASSPTTSRSPSSGQAAPGRNWPAAVLGRLRRRASKSIPLPAALRGPAQAHHGACSGGDVDGSSVGNSLPSTFVAGAAGALFGGPPGDSFARTDSSCSAGTASTQTAHHGAAVGAGRAAELQPAAAPSAAGAAVTNNGGGWPSLTPDSAFLLARHFLTMAVAAGSCEAYRTSGSASDGFGGTSSAAAAAAAADGGPDDFRISTVLTGGGEAELKELNSRSDKLARRHQHWRAAARAEQHPSTAAAVGLGLGPSGSAPGAHSRGAHLRLSASLGEADLLLDDEELEQCQGGPASLGRLSGGGPGASRGRAGAPRPSAGSSGGGRGGAGARLGRHSSGSGAGFMYASSSSFAPQRSSSPFLDAAAALAAAAAGAPTTDCWSSDGDDGSDEDEGFFSEPGFSPMEGLAVRILHTEEDFQTPPQSPDDKSMAAAKFLGSTCCVEGRGADGEERHYGHQAGAGVGGRKIFFLKDGALQRSAGGDLHEEDTSGRGGSPDAYVPAEQLLTLEDFNQHLSLAAQQGNRGRADVLWNELCSKGVMPDMRTLNTMLRCLANSMARPDEAENLAKEVCMAGNLSPNAMTYNLLAETRFRYEQLCGAT